MGAVVEREAEHLGTSDIAIIFMRRLLIQAACDLPNGIEPVISSHPEWHNVLPVDVDSTDADLSHACGSPVSRSARATGDPQAW